jgi:aminopeptidase N
MRFIITSLTLLALFSSGSASGSYFQQRVNYNIKIALDPATSRLDGSEALYYHNNSPDTLHDLYFHLYYNAFQPGSYLDKRAQEYGDYDINSTSARDAGYINIDQIKNDGIHIENHVIDNTIMRVPLINPLPPGDSTYFYFEFTSQIPTHGGRAAHRGNHFDVGQWYPKPAVYDRFGWHIDQHLYNGEFFGEYGDYYAEITLPDSFIVAHCGTLLNESEIFGGRLPKPDGDSIIVDALKYIVQDSSHVSADINIGDDAPDIAGGELSVSKSEKLKTWKIRISNVHDFAFCADPKFTIDICRFEDIVIKSYYTPQTKGHWKRNAAEFTRKALEYFSKEYYPWPYQQYSTVTSMVSGGMEYPDMTMISGKYSAENRYDHSLEATIAHEVGHAWFYGILGFNETDEAFLDEGMTSLATVNYLEHFYGRFENNFTYKRGWQMALLPNGNQRNDEQKRYIGKALTGTEDPLATPSDQFHDWWSYYVASYHKASSVYLMLQQTMGKDKFDRFIDTLFERWAFCHPYLIDVHSLAEEIYGDNLDWFFRQWFQTTWTLDYALESVRSVRTDSGGKIGYSSTVLIKNNGRCIAPLTLTFYHQNAPPDTLKIPVSTWQKGIASFDTTAFFESKPSKVIIDSELMLADINRLNNSSGILPPVTFQFMVPKFIYPQNYIEYFADSYRIAHRPSAWYNSVDGAKLGYILDGAYLEYFKNLHLGASVGLNGGNVHHAFAFSDMLLSGDPRFSYFMGTRELEGRGRQEAGVLLESLDPDDPRATRAAIAIRRNYLFDPEYLYGDGWSPGDIVTADLSLSQVFTLRFGKIVLQGDLSNATFGSDYQFRRAAAGMALSVAGVGAGEARLSIKMGRADGNVPLQRRFLLSTADPYDIWDSPLFRSRGTLPDRWKNDGHLYKPGGAGLGGYLDRAISGTRIMSIQLSNDLPAPGLPLNIPIVSAQLSDINPRLYLAGGRVWSIENTVDDYLFEAGFVLEYKVPYLDYLITENRLSLHLPLWLSDLSDGDDNLKWRWAFTLTP